MREDYFNSSTGKISLATFVVVDKYTIKFNIRIDYVSNKITPNSYRFTDKFNPLINRLSTPIALNAFVIGQDTIYYEVINGIYTVAKDGLPGVLKLKVKKKYGK